MITVRVEGVDRVAVSLMTEAVYQMAASHKLAVYLIRAEEGTVVTEKTDVLVISDIG